MFQYIPSPAGFFTLGIGRMFRVESLTLMKIGAVFTRFVAMAAWIFARKSPCAHVGPRFSI